MHKRTKALMISPAVKAKVWERDGGRCLWCGVYNAAPEAHYIPRSRSGLGIEENVLTLCRKCHDTFDNPSTDAEIATSRKMKVKFRHYLKRKYPNWKEENLYYVRR